MLRFRTVILTFGAVLGLVGLRTSRRLGPLRRRSGSENECTD